MKISRLLFTIVLLSFVVVAGNVFAYEKLGKPTGYVNDYTGTLSPNTKVELETLLRSFKESGAGEISVVMIPSLGGDSIENYSIEVAREWGIGTKGKDNGVLLFIAKDDRKLRIEVGYGFEGVLTDAKSSRIIRDVITPRFKDGDYDAGVTDGVREIVGLLAPTFVGGTQAIDYRAVPTSSNNTAEFFFTVIFPVLFFLQWLAAVLARSKSWWAGGIVGGIIGIATSFFVSTFYVGAIVTIVLIVFGLLFDYVISNKYSSSMSNGNPLPWWTGGGGSSGGGFGGFSGGSFGGGGSSGSW